MRLALIALPPKDGLYNEDELILALSSLDHFLGLPPSLLQWPATPLQLVGVLIYVPKFLLSLLSDHSLEYYSRTLFAYYSDPSSVIQTFRVISALSAAASAAVIFIIVYEISLNLLASIVTAVAISILPLFLDLSLMARPDAVSLLFCTLCARWLICSPVRPTLAAAMAAAAVISKFVFVIWIFPIFCAGIAGYAYHHRASEFLKNSMLAIGAGLISALFLFPYVWSDPLRFAKSMVANVVGVTKDGIPRLEIFSFDLPGECVLASLLLLSGIAGLVAVKDKQWRWLGVGLAFSMIVSTLGIWWLQFGYWRYVLGAIVPVAMLIAILVKGLNRTTIVPILTFVMVGFSAISVLQQIKWRTGPGLLNLLNVVDQKCARGEKIWLQDAILSLRYDHLPLTHESIVNIMGFMESPERWLVLRQVLARAGISPAAASALQPAFNEYEQTQLARWRGLALFGQPNSRCPMELFSAANAVTRNPETGAGF